MSMPATMAAVEIRGFGDPEVLTPTERPVPVPAAGEVLIRVAAAGVNRPDVFQRKGGYAPPPGASDLPGLEVAGTVVATGPRRSRAGGRATRCAPCSPVVATPSTPSRRRGSACLAPRSFR